MFSSESVATLLQDLSSKKQRKERGGRGMQIQIKKQKSRKGIAREKRKKKKNILLQLCYNTYLQPAKKQRKGKERDTKKICGTRIEGEIRRKRTMFSSESVETLLQEISSTSTEIKKRKGRDRNTKK